MKLQICYFIKAVMGIFMGIGTAVMFGRHIIFAILFAIILGSINVFAASYLVNYDIKNALEGNQE